MSVDYASAKKLVHNVAVHLGTTDDEAFEFICLCNEKTGDETQTMKDNFKQGYRAPRWFIDTGIDIVTGKLNTSNIVLP